MVPVRVRNARFVLPLVCVAALVAGCGADDPPPDPADGPALQVEVSTPPGHTLLLGAEDPAELALTTSQRIYERSPVAVLADAASDDPPPDAGKDADGAAVRAAQASAAEALGAPALVVGGAVSAHGVAAELDRLGVQVAVVVSPEPLGAVGPQGAGDGAEPADPDGAAEDNWSGDAAAPRRELTGAEQAAATVDADVVHLRVDALPDAGKDEPGALSAAEAASLQDDVDAALAHGTSPAPQDPAEVRLREVLALTDPQPGQEAAIATLRAAGAVDHEVPGGDIAASPESIAEIDLAQALSVVGVGPTFGDAEGFAWRVETAERGALLPTGSQQLLPARYVTVTAEPWEEPEDVTARAAAAAEAYADLDDGPVVPTVVVLAGAAQGRPAEERVAELEPLVDAARDAGQYVVLDVAVGTSALLEEVESLEELVSGPGVGLALHPENRVSDGVLPPGQVSVEEVEAVITYIEGVVTNNALPPTAVVVHQTRPESVVDRERLADVAAGTDAVEIVLAADRTGGPTTGEWVWNHVSDVPDGVHTGWAGPTYPTAGAAALVPTDPAPLFVAGS